MGQNARYFFNMLFQLSEREGNFTTTVKHWNNSENTTCNSMLVMDRHYLFAFRNFCAQGKRFYKIPQNTMTHYMWPDKLKTQSK